MHYFCNPFPRKLHYRYFNCCGSTESNIKHGVVVVGREGGGGGGKHTFSYSVMRKGGGVGGGETISFPMYSRGQEGHFFFSPMDLPNHYPPSHK